MILWSTRNYFFIYKKGLAANGMFLIESGRGFFIKQKNTVFFEFFFYGVKSDVEVDSKWFSRSEYFEFSGKVCPSPSVVKMGQRRRFFNWVQTSVRLCVSGSQKFLGKIGLILKLRDVKFCSSFFILNFWK